MRSLSGPSQTNRTARWFTFRALTGYKESAAALSEAKARHRSAQAASRYAETKSERWASLRAKDLVSDLDMLRAKAEAEQQKEGADAINLEVSRLAYERSTRETAMVASLDELERDEVRLEGEAATAQRTIERLEHEIDRRTIRAPVAGQLGQVTRLRPGSMVEEGERLAALVPFGELEVIARFVPGEALGRVRIGQPARLRLDGFPWTQYGSIAAQVTEVASEPEADRVQVVLRAQPQSARNLPLSHGLPGTVDVDVEHVSPATLVLRAAGRLVTPTSRSSMSSSTQ